MAGLHAALQALAPVEYPSVPRENLQGYLLDHFAKAQVLIDSVPIPPSDAATPTGRSRANTTSSVASCASEMSASSARSAPPIAEHAVLQKEWGKPIKLSAKDNPLGMAVYRLGAKDSRGAWFARRSVHEGIGFSKWRAALEREFPTSMEVQGAPGEGNIRGIGGERRIEREVVDGVGKLEVYHLSAQFPGPTAPRDFVTLLLTSSVALNHTSAGRDSVSSANTKSPTTADPPPRVPRHFMVISKPCIHPDCPPRDGFVRGQYESIEFIREVPTGSRKGAGLEVPRQTRNRANSASLARDSIVRNASKAHTFPHNLDPSQDGRATIPDAAPSAGAGQGTEAAGRARGKTISFVESAGGEVTANASLTGRKSHDLDETEESNPVEWIMITRSDPGGNVPRWMVERGTPSSIVADAIKFLDWACKLEDSHVEENDERINGRPALPERDQSHDLQALDTNGRLWGVNGNEESGEIGSRSAEKGGSTDEDSRAASTVGTGDPIRDGSITEKRPLADHAHGSPQSGAVARTAVRTSEQSESVAEVASDDSDTASTASFATASSGELGSERDGDDRASTTHDVASSSPSVQVAREKEYAKHQDRKRRLQEKLAAARSKILSAGTTSTSGLPAKEGAALTKAEERHKKELEKEDERYLNQVKKIESKREREERKHREKLKKHEHRDEKTRWSRERAELRRQLEASKGETAALMGQIGALQAQNTLLAAKLGKVDPLALKEVLAEKETPGQALGSTRGLGPGGVGSVRQGEGDTTTG